MLFIFVKIEYTKNAQKYPKIAILDLFQLTASSKQPIKGFFWHPGSPQNEPGRPLEWGHI